MLSLLTKNTTLVGGRGGVNEHKEAIANGFDMAEIPFIFVVFMERKLGKKMCPMRSYT